MELINERLAIVYLKNFFDNFKRLKIYKIGLKKKVQV